jgi:hypothetical protein
VQGACGAGDTLLGPLGVPASVAILLVMGAAAGAALAALAFWLAARKRRRYDAEFRERFGGGLEAQLPGAVEVMVKRAATSTFRPPGAAAQGAGAGAPGAPRLPRTAATLREGPLQVGVAASLSGLPAGLLAGIGGSGAGGGGMLISAHRGRASGLDGSASVIIRDAGLVIHQDQEGCDGDFPAAPRAAGAAAPAGAGRPAPALLPAAAAAQATPCKGRSQLRIEVQAFTPLPASTPPSSQAAGPAAGGGSAPSGGASATPFATTAAARAAHRAAARELLGASEGAAEGATLEATLEATLRLGEGWPAVRRSLALAPSRQTERRRRSRCRRGAARWRTRRRRRGGGRTRSGSRARSAARRAS